MSVIESMKSMFFGVEVEFVGVSRRDVAYAVASILGGCVSYVGGCLGTYRILSDTGLIWRVSLDGSLRDGILSDDLLCELISPKLTYADLPVLFAICDAIKGLNPKISPSCGVHVHTDASSHTAKSIRNLVFMFYHKQHLLEDAVGMNFVRKGKCASLQSDFVSRLAEGFVMPADASKDTLGPWWYGRRDWRDFIYKKYNPTRYKMLNLHCLWRQGTIEFRLFNSTLETVELKAYIDLSLLLSAGAMGGQTVSFREPVLYPNAKYAMRAWLVHLGLNGQEFASTRSVLLSKLTGNSSYKGVSALSCDSVDLNRAVV